MFYNNDSEIAIKHFEQILATIENKDKDALITLFSKKAPDESKLIDEDIDYLFTFIQGEVISWEQNKGLSVSEKFDYGQRMKEMKSWFIINTDKQKYLVFILDYIEDSANPENVGLYTLRIIKAEDKKLKIKRQNLLIGKI